MTMEEILKAQGIEDAKVAEILDAMKAGKVYTAGEENLDVRYGKLKDEHAGTRAELEKANGVIAELQKANKGNEALQAKVAEYQAEVEKLRIELAESQLDAAIKVGLIAEHAADVDYLTFKLRESGELTLDEHGEIKGWADKVAGLKTQYPMQFETPGGARKLEPNKLPSTDEKSGPSKADVLKMPYAERVALYQQDSQAFNDLMKG